MIPPFFMPWTTGRERGRHDRRGGCDRTPQRLSERLRQAHSVMGGSFLILPELTSAERLRAAQSDPWRSTSDRALRGPQNALFQTGTGKQSHHQRNGQHRPAQRLTEALRAQSGTVASTQAHGERRSGATGPSGSEALRSGSDMVRQRLSGGHPSGRCCPIFWTVYGPVIHSRQLDASNRSS